MNPTPGTRIVVVLCERRQGMTTGSDGNVGAAAGAAGAMGAGEHLT